MMGSNLGNGMPSMEMGPMLGNGSAQPPATEYTLQGVMRFLQTEWHRHERDRNSWEIEKQEMKGRIANLEGQARRADATQKALRKYVSILERKVKDQAAQLKGSGPDPSEEASKADRAAQIQEKLQPSLEKHVVPGVEDIDLGRPDDEKQRQELKSFLDQCQEEFMYLLLTPANPPPPRESPPLPMMEDLRDVDYGMHGQQAMDKHRQIVQRPMQNHIQDIKSRPHPPPNHAPPPQPGISQYSREHPSELQPQAMMRSNPHHQRYPEPSGWSAPPVSVTTTAIDEPLPSAKDAVNNLANMGEASAAGDQQRSAGNDPDGWDFSEGTLPDSTFHNVTNRPDTDAFPIADNIPKSPNRMASHRRKGSMSRRRSAEHDWAQAKEQVGAGNFKLRFGLRGHLEPVRTVIFSGGGSPGEPEICTGGDDGMIKRFNIPRMDGYPGTSAGVTASDLDVVANFTHRGHSGAILSLTSWSPSPNFSTGGRAVGDGWIFSGGQDATIRVWERGRVDPKATLEGHTDAVWTLCVLPTTLGNIFGNSSQYGSPDRILLVSGAADGTVRLWAVSAPPQLSSPQPGGNRPASGRGGRVRGNSMSSGSGFSNTPQPSTASNSLFSHTLVHTINRSDTSEASPTCIAPIGASGEKFVVSYSDSSIVVYDTRTGEQIGYMDSTETYDGSLKTSVNSVVATTNGLDQGQHHGSMGEEDATSGGPTGGKSMSGSGVEGTIISGHEDRFVRFFDANSGQCTYNMLAHPDAISSLSLSPDGRELVSAGHDGSLRFWSLETRSCTQEMTSHRAMRGEGTCSCVWSSDGNWVVSGGGDGMVKVFAR